MPLDFRISTLMVFGPGQPYQMTDQTLGAGAFQIVSSIGHIKSSLSGPPRTFQFGARFSF